MEERIIVGSILLGNGRYIILHVFIKVRGDPNTAVFLEIVPVNLGRAVIAVIFELL